MFPNGTTIIDESTGWLESSKINQKIKGSMVIGAKGNTLESPIDIDGTITVETK